MKTLFKAIADFQQEVPIIHKGTQGYGYSYADLPTIFKTINPLLKKHKLGFYQAVNGTQIKTVIFHFDGEFIESLTDIPQNVSLKGMNSFQVLGASITYIRRYALESMLGLVASKDTDAGGEEVPEWWDQAIAAIKKGSVTIERVIKDKELDSEMAEKLRKDVS